MTHTSRDIRLQAYLANPDGVSQYRFSLTGRISSTLLLSPVVYRRMTYLLNQPVLPNFPPGNWNEGHGHRGHVLYHFYPQ
ncbi:hypothetical protein F5Y03DRAFT_368832 [Xylaria venustula]|nr:hypothetical protein F5Y03DRAFT_368832 [Xylaria venustula]